MFNPVSYIKEVGSELKKVTWPTRKQTIDMTMIVVIISLVVAVYLTGVDFFLNKVITSIIK
ncbi:MAG: preprotein translocase subunit SecE [Candidatus Pacebacteria bacterium]|nr:preprotein translocase subunit SecE [Candidatus Paceibacterota bacterium]